MSDDVGSGTAGSRPSFASDSWAILVGILTGILVYELSTALWFLLERLHWLPHTFMFDWPVGPFLPGLTTVPLLGLLCGWLGEKYRRPLVMALIGGLAGIMWGVSLLWGTNLERFLSGNQVPDWASTWTATGVFALLNALSGAASAFVAGWLARRRSRPNQSAPADLPRN
jgi:hypothetical protein